PGCAGSGVKLVALVTVPAGVVTEIGPAVAPAGTTVVIWVGELTVNVALVPLNLTAVAPMKLSPVMMIELPTVPLAGTEVMLGGCAANGVKFDALVAVPLGVATKIGPVVAPAGTTAVICVAEST